MKSVSVRNCIEILNKLGSDNDLLVAWIPGHTGVYGNERADDLAKAGSLLGTGMYGPELFIPIPYATCIREIKEWS